MWLALGSDASLVVGRCRVVTVRVITISESSPITGAHKYCSTSFIAAILALPGPTLCLCYRKMPFRVWGAIGAHS